MFPIAEDSDRGDASPKSGLPSSAAPMASDSTRCAEPLKSGDYDVTEAATMTGLIVHSVLANVIDYVYSTS